MGDRFAPESVIDLLRNTHNRDLSSSNPNRPFTGCDHDGTANPQNRALGKTSVRIGWPNEAGANNGPISSSNFTGGGSTRPFYALSEVFQVASGNTDATLRTLSLARTNGNEVTLDQTFASDTYTYTASVGTRSRG